MRFGLVIGWFVLVSLVVMPACWAGDSALDEAVHSKDADEIVARFHSLAREDAARASTLIPMAYAAVEASTAEDFYQGDRYRIFSAAVQALAGLRAPAEVKTLGSLYAKAKEGPVRFLLLHTALQHPGLDAIAMALTGLKDDYAEVVALSARILRNTRDIAMLDPVLDAMARWETRGTQEKLKGGRKVIAGSDGGARAWLACRDTLHALTGQSLLAADDFRNYIRAHRDSIDPNKIDPSEQREVRTGVGLFGLDVTGRNIFFLLDVSGSMEATDPFTPEQIEKLGRGRTGVGGSDPLEEEMILERKRIRRAKRELAAVIRALPEDRRFNVIAYSSEVTSWKETMSLASDSAKREAVEFVETLVAKGVTVTDDALYRAFADPTVDTVYLITDGAPTHMGSQGPDLPEDAPRLMKQILTDLKAANYLRQIRLFTLGFEGAEEAFLQRLADENFGKYTSIR